MDTRGCLQTGAGWFGWMVWLDGWLNDLVEWSGWIDLVGGTHSLVDTRRARHGTQGTHR